jgi:hypothetical protein
MEFYKPPTPYLSGRTSSFSDTGENCAKTCRKTFPKSEEHRKASIEAILENMKATFGNLSLLDVFQSPVGPLNSIPKNKTESLQDLEPKVGIAEHYLPEI